MKRIKRTHQVALGLLLAGAFTLAPHVGLGQSGSSYSLRSNVQPGEPGATVPKPYARHSSPQHFDVTIDRRFDHSSASLMIPGELGFLTPLNFQKYLTDPDTAAHIEWGLGGKTIASVEDVFAQLSPAAGGTEGLAGIVPEVGEVTAGGSRAAANTFGDPQFGTPFPLNIFDPGPQARTAPPLPEEDQPIIVAEEPIIVAVEPPPPPPTAGTAAGVVVRPDLTVVVTQSAPKPAAGERSGATDTPWIDLADRARNWIYNRYAGWIYIGHPEGAKGAQEGSGSAAGES